MGLGLDALKDITAEKGIRFVRHIGGTKGFWLPEYNAISLRRDLNDINARCTFTHELDHAARGHPLCDGPFPSAIDVAGCSSLQTRAHLHEPSSIAGRGL
ncbi:hypothetical protein CCICO_08675 [Corynebacterium ciconiae DSM 44920]|nr:hypothetical protein CCICO_08675 [Corynebacterium ciconiae DSM 44920]